MFRFDVSEGACVQKARYIQSQLTLKRFMTQNDNIHTSFSYFFGTFYFDVHVQGLAAHKMYIILYNTHTIHLCTVTVYILM